MEKYNGKGLHFLTTEVLECLKIYPTARIIMAGGICDCSHRPNRLVNFKCTFTSMSEMSEDIMALFYDSNNRIRTEYPGARVCYSELIGMDLLEYKNIDNPFPGQHDIFDAAIMDINTKIVALNKSNNMPTPWIAKRVHIMRKNGAHHQYCRWYSLELRPEKRLCR